MSKYKIIITLILFCFFQTTPSISLELKLKIPKDLKKLGDKVKKELEKKTPEVKKEEVKKKEVKKKEVKKISTTNNNYIYYSDVVNDKYFRKIGFFKRGKGARKVNLTNFSYIVKSPDKDYEVEYIATIESEKKDSGWTIYSGKFTAINLKTEESKTYRFSAGEDGSSFKFLESSLFLEIKNARATWYQYTGMTCKNEQNPQCMKRLDEVSIIGFRDLKNNLTYAEFVSNYKKKVVEEKRIAEEKRIEKEKLQIQKQKAKEEEKQAAAAAAQAAAAAKDAKTEKICKEFTEKNEGEQKSKTLGGYKDFYFGMPQKDVNKFIYCQSYFNKEIFYNDFTQERGKAKGYFIQNMYKYNTGVRLKDGKVNSIDVQLFVNIRQKLFYFGKASEEFEQIKKAVLDKYKLISKPTKVSIDEFNSEEYGRLEWVLKSNIDDNLILLIFKQSPGRTKYFYTGMIDYLSSEESKIYRKELDSKVVKPDDL